MKDGQTGDLTYHGTGTLSTMDLTGILWVKSWWLTCHVITALALFLLMTIHTLQFTLFTEVILYCRIWMNVKCVVPENIHTRTHPKKGYWKIKGVGRSQKPHFLKESMKLNWNFPGVGWGGGGKKNKKTFHRGYGYFLEPRNILTISLGMHTEYFATTGFQNWFMSSTVDGGYNQTSSRVRAESPFLPSSRKRRLC